MKTIVFLNNKGGVGKTASVVSLAHILATVHRRRVLIVDLDPQANTTARFSPVNVMEIISGMLSGTAVKNSTSVEDLLLDQTIDVHSCIYKTKYPGLDLIPAFLTLSEAEERLKADVKVPQQIRLRGHLAKLRREYDFCLIDCGPNIGLLNINALSAADEVYIPARTDADSCLGVALTMDLVRTVQAYNPALKIGGAYLTQVDPRKVVDRGVSELMRELLGDKLLDIKIGVSKYLAENSWSQQPLLEADAGKNKSKVTLQYMELAALIDADHKNEINAAV